MQDEFYIPPIKLGDVTEFFVLALAGVQQPSPAPALAGLCESTRCASPLRSASDSHKAPLSYGRKKKKKVGGIKNGQTQSNQQIPFA